MSYTWAVPIVLFLFVQTSTTIWWASSINSTVNTTADSFATFSESAEELNILQDAKINANTLAIKDVSGAMKEVIVSITYLREIIEDVKEDTSETNALIREYFLNR